MKDFWKIFIHPLDIIFENEWVELENWLKVELDSIGPYYNEIECEVPFHFLLIFFNPLFIELIEQLCFFKEYLFWISISFETKQFQPHSFYHDNKSYYFLS